mgnify:CR=1 FL=1
MESQFGIAHVWAQGDFVSRSVAILLLLMSVASWAVIIIKALALVKMKKYASKAEGFWHSEDFGIALDKLGMEADNPFRTMALEGREAVAHHRKTCDHLHDTLDISDWITRSLRYCVDGCTQRLQSGLSILASVGSTAPFVGLFGTVWGIYHALVAIGMSGQSSIDKVAGPVGEALIMTGFGLAVALPAVLVYNLFVRRNRLKLAALDEFAYDLFALLVTGVEQTSARVTPLAAVDSTRQGKM